jgi:hypothetical protein
VISAGGERAVADEHGGNRFDGKAHGVVQGRDFHGDIHFHAPTNPKAPPRQVPPPSRFYTNNDRQLVEITEFLRPGRSADEQPPALAGVSPLRDSSACLVLWCLGFMPG